MKIKQGFSLRKVGNENIIVAVESKQIDFCRIISLNESATGIWKSLIGREFNIETVASILVDWYEVDATTATQDAQNILSAWKTVGLIE